MIRATDADRPAIEAFLASVPEYAMFPLSNLATHGMAGGHQRAVGFWLGRRAGKITDVLTMTEEGMVMPYLPSADYQAAAVAMRGRTVIGMVGRKACVRGLEAAGGLTLRPKTLDHDEPHFLLTLDRLVVPEGPGRIVPLVDAPRKAIMDWMLDYQIAALGTPPDQAPDRVNSSYLTYIEAGSHVALIDGDIPLAMTGFNARVPQMVQIGGVYTPHDLRGQGHARRAVALHLAMARAMGVTRATLFSASEMAARAYRAIGFRQIGEWTLLIFHHKELVP
ncbi:MAG: GNAT family N-acetyltransferase [bacterium]